MKVTLINFTKDAISTLIYTKNTRLDMSSSMDLINSMTASERVEELHYMINTIKSSWEFVDFTFSIEDVSRAFTHQFVRTRTNSYAQQTMRMLEKSEFTYVTGPGIKTQEQESVYDYCMDEIQYCYDKLIKLGVPIEDARGLLPTNIHTNITVKINLRTLSDMMQSRASSRTQGEYRDVLDAMYNAVTNACPWVAPFLRNGKTHALDEIETIVRSTLDIQNGCRCVKLLDQIRNAK